MIANVKLIEAVLQKYTAYKIGKETGISYSTVNDWKKGITSVYSMKLEYAIKLTELALKEYLGEKENKMQKLFIHIDETKQSSYQLEQLIKSSMVNDYFCFDTYQELADFIRSYCFNENHEFESNVPFDTRFEEFESDPEDDDAYNTFYESLTEKDFKEICEDYKDDFKIKYIEFDVDDEIKYFKQKLKMH